MCKSKWKYQSFRHFFTLSNCGVPSHGRNSCKNRINDEDAGCFYKIHPNRGKILSNNEATKRLQPANDASYQEQTQLCRNDKDRACTAKTWNQLVDSSSTNIDMVDKNHNTQSTTDPFSPKPPGKPTYQERAAGIRKSQSTGANRCYPENFSPITRLKLKPKENEPINHLRYKARVVNEQQPCKIKHDAVRNPGKNPILHFFPTEDGSPTD